MALTSATRSLIGEVASWTVLAAGCATAILNFDTITRGMTLLVGLPPIEAQAPSTTATAEAEAQARADGTVELRAGANGHFHAEAEINGRPVEVLVDTGASMVALTYEDAETAGIYLNPADFTHAVSTANGIARVAPVTFDRISIGDITVRNVSGVVSERGKLMTSLLGMSFLGKLERVDIRSGLLVLQD